MFYANQDKVASQSSGYDLGLRSYMQFVYRNMSIALVVTGLTALIVASSPALMAAIFGTPLRYLVTLGPIGFALYFYSRIASMSTASAQKCLFGFAALMGLSLSYLLAVFSTVSVAKAFFATAAMFGGMSIYGNVTGKDLSEFGSFMIMGVWGVIIASLLNLIFRSPAIHFAISVVAVIAFTGLTAYDTQRIKSAYYSYGGSPDTLSKIAVMGALTLYMDVINIFVNLLNIIGDRK